MTEEKKRLTDQVSLLREMLSPFVCAIYNGQARDWDHEAVFSMLTGKNDLKSEDLPTRLTEEDVLTYIDKLFAQHESKTTHKLLAFLTNSSSPSCSVEKTAEALE